MPTTLTSKGQITLPKAIRERLGLKPGDKMDFVVNDQGEVQLLPVTRSVTALKGMVPCPEQPVSLEAMQEAIEKGSVDP